MSIHSVCTVDSVDLSYVHILLSLCAGRCKLDIRIRPLLLPCIFQFKSPTCLLTSLSVSCLSCPQLLRGVARVRMTSVQLQSHLSIQLWWSVPTEAGLSWYDLPNADQMAGRVRWTVMLPCYSLQPSVTGAARCVVYGVCRPEGVLIPERWGGGRGVILSRSLIVGLGQGGYTWLLPPRRGRVTDAWSLRRTGHLGGMRHLREMGHLGKMGHLVKMGHLGKMGHLIEMSISGSSQPSWDRATTNHKPKTHQSHNTMHPQGLKPHHKPSTHVRVYTSIIHTQ